MAEAPSPPPVGRPLLEGLVWRPSPHFDARPEGELPSLLVVHGISLPAGSFGGPWVEALFAGDLLDPPEALVASNAWLQDLKGLRVSAHFFIDRLGMTTQLVSTLDRAWHAGQSSYQGRARCNDFSIGVELEGTDLVPYTGAQYDSLARLCRSLADLHPSLSAVVGHEDIAPGRKTDPGPAFDWLHLEGLLRANGVGWASPHRRCGASPR